MAALKREIERCLDSAEARAYLEQPVTDAEREAVLGLVRWFRRRYPTPAARLACARRAYRWNRMRQPGLNRQPSDGDLTEWSAVARDRWAGTTFVPGQGHALAFS